MSVQYSDPLDQRSETAVAGPWELRIILDFQKTLKKNSNQKHEFGTESVCGSGV